MATHDTHPATPLDVPAPIPLPSPPAPREEGSRLARRLDVVLAGVVLLLDEQADLAVVAGLLELERGRPREAKRQLRRALACGPNFAARPLAQEYLRRLDRAARGRG